MQAAEWGRQNNKWRVQTVRAMFADAVRMGCCERNPFASLGHPKSRGRPDIKVLTADEVQRLADCAVETWGDGLGRELKAMIVFAAYTGLRLGECCALEWSDIDYAAGEVTVNKTVSNDKEIVLPLKGELRTVVLSPIAEQALKAMPQQLHRDCSLRAAIGPVLYEEYVALLLASDPRPVWKPRKPRQQLHVP